MNEVMQVRAASWTSMIKQRNIVRYTIPPQWNSIPDNLRMLVTLSEKYDYPMKRTDRYVYLFSKNFSSNHFPFSVRMKEKHSRR